MEAGRDADGAPSDSELLTALSCKSTATSEALDQLVSRVKAPSATNEPVSVEAFLALRDSGRPMIDVRSPGEFDAGHIPGAQSLPLFSNEERAVVGTCYKQQTREAAMIEGMAFVGPRLLELVARARAVGGSADHGQQQQQPCRVAVYCWRGGMRSGAVAWLLRQHGLEVAVLAGGYKAFRGWALSTWGEIAMPVPKAKQRKPKPQRGAPASAPAPPAGCEASSSSSSSGGGGGDGGGGGGGGGGAIPIA